MKLKQLARPFLDDCFRSGRKPSTLTNHKIHLEKTIVPLLGDLDIEDLKMTDVGRIIERARTFGPSCPTHAVITFRRLLRFATHEGHHPIFDWRDIEVPHYRTREDVQALTLDDIRYVRKALSQDWELSKYASSKIQEGHHFMLARTKCLFEVLLHTGLRLSEALAINIKELDLEKAELRVRNVKTETWDTVYLYGCVDAINDYLKLRMDEHPALFISNSGVRLPLDTAKSTLVRLNKTLFMKKKLTHKICRATFVTTLLRAKRDPKEVQLLARHNSLQTTLDYYYHVAKESLKPIHRAVMEYL